MKTSPQATAAVFIGFLLTFASAWVGLVLLPAFNLGRAAAFTTGIDASTDRTDHDLVEVGRRVYVENGCIYCHSQQIRPRHAGSDKEFGWGDRRTVPTDYLNDKVALLGTMRTGPDLSNIGIRQPSENWQLLHLYNPQTTSKGSLMPPFAFLFEKRRISGQPSPDALSLPPGFEIPAGYEIVPTPEAKALVAYLLSLQKSRKPIGQ